MTASCPYCGGKWGIEGEHYDLILRCGDELDIRCSYCKNDIEFELTREWEKKTSERAYMNLYKLLEETEEKLKKMTARCTYEFQLPEDLTSDDECN